MHDYAKTPEIQVGKSDGSRYCLERFREYGLQLQVVQYTAKQSVFFSQNRFSVAQEIDQWDAGSVD